MAARRRGNILAGLGALLGICTGISGCQTLHAPGVAPKAAPVQAAVAPASFRGQPSETQPAPDLHLVSAPQGLLEPCMQCQWLVEADQMPDHRMGATSVIGPDGTIEIGPYGSVRVAGLTTEQAREAIRKHLANYIAEPRVTVAAPASSGVENAAWQTGQAGSAANDNGESSTWRPVQRAGSPNEAPAPRVRLASGTLQPVTVAPLQPMADTQGGAAETAPPPRTVQAEPPAANADHPGAIVEHPGMIVEHPDPMEHHGAPPVPRELHKMTLPAYVVEPPDILLVEVSGIPKGEQQVFGQHLVRPDGTIGLGGYGSLRVAGMTLDQIRDSLVEFLKPEYKEVTLKKVSVDVISYNSKFYYIIADGAGFGEQMFRLPVTGNETVLDGIALINGLPAVSSKYHIWVARRSPGGFGTEKILPVDWIGITQRGAAATNYQIMPGDRIYVKADKWRTFDTKVGKILSPFERMLGITLLGSETVNSIRNKGAGGSSVP